MNTEACYFVENGVWLNSTRQECLPCLQPCSPTSAYVFQRLSLFLAQDNRRPYRVFAERSDLSSRSLALVADRRVRTTAWSTFACAPVRPADLEEGSTVRFTVLCLCGFTGTARSVRSCRWIPRKLDHLGFLHGTNI